MLSSAFDMFHEEATRVYALAHSASAADSDRDGVQTILDRVRDYAMELMRRGFCTKLE
jgi:hypothetical protein